MKRPLLAATLSLLAATGPAGAQGPARTTVSVAAAANLKVAVEELEREFEAATPGVDVVVTLGASGAFFAQIQAGAPFDLLLSADRAYPRKLAEAGLAAPGSEVVYAIGRLVAWVPAGSSIPLETRGLAALADPAVRHLAIANPAVAPWGRVAEQLLREAGLLDALRARLVLGQSVAQAAQFAVTGAADAALLPRSLTFAPGLRAGRTLALPAFQAGLPQSAVVLSGAKRPELARAFLAFVTGAKGRAILARYGYDLP